MSVQPDTTQALVDAVFLLGRSLRYLITNETDAVLPAAMIGVLFVLAGRGECRQNELASEMFVSQSSLSRQVSELVDGGYVIRETDPGDRRASRIRVSPSGMEVLRITKERRAARLRDTLEGWSQTEADAAVDSLNRLNETFCAANHQRELAIHTNIGR
ncbi:MarR family winged helix-turn-helix transcriptional regulator [Rhodococcus sp. NPDC058521]|uniref:MarR family winged helix-turn-helix transcriptional regulator n=1 Tax=Rhodococcus sp. NPDC058521 TaxID=3346536 RepID=UPI0036484635